MDAAFMHYSIPKPTMQAYFLGIVLAAVLATFTLRKIAPTQIGPDSKIIFRSSNPSSSDVRWVGQKWHPVSGKLSPFTWY